MKDLRLIKSLPLFKDITVDDLQQLVAKCLFCELKRGEILFSAGNPASHTYIILSGSMKLVKAHPDGKERIVHILMRGDILGAVVAMQNGLYPVSALALEETSVMKIEIKNFKDIFLLHPKIGQTLINQMGERIQQAHIDRSASFDSVEKRIAVFLLDLLNRVQLIFGKTSRIPIPLTRQDIADRVGSSVETVIRILSLWTKDNLLVTQDKYIEIPDPESLNKTLNLD